MVEMTGVVPRVLGGVLHAEGVEILSPTYMNQRRLEPGARAIPPQVETPTTTEPSPDQDKAEALAFDKAERAERLEARKAELTETIARQEAALKEARDEAERSALRDKLEDLRQRLQDLQQAGDAGED